jgi:UDP-2,3-diacylglucosamine hydrolase
MVKKVFSNRLLQKLYGTIHPNLGLRLMRKFSSKSREYNSPDELAFLGAEREWLVQFSESYVRENDIDYFVFGHRHLPINYQLSNGTSLYVNLGDWLSHYSYGRLQNGKLELLFFENDNGKIYP